MTAPKPGDRVRVTFEAVVEKVYDDLVRVCTQATTCGAFGGSVPIEAVEVLAPPVYVNHDTTEYRIGDVIRDSRGELYIRQGLDMPSAWVDSIGDEWGEDRPEGFLTLLVRGGQVVT